MDSKHTMLLSRTPASETTVAPDVCVVRLNTVTRQLDEFRSGASVPAAEGTGIHVYTVPRKPVESVFAVLGAIDCVTPSGASFRPGMCLNIRLRYISPIGLKTLLIESTGRKGYVPDCVTIGDLYDIVSSQIRSICEKAAEAFSGGKRLSYEHWWQELTSGSTYVESLKAPLLALFNSFGFRFEPDSLAIKGVSGIIAG